MTRTVKSSTPQPSLRQMLLQGCFLAVLVLMPTLVQAEEDTDSAFVSTADLELSDTAGTELNVRHAEPAQPVSGLTTEAPTPAQSLIDASLAAAGVRPGSEPDSAPKPTPLPKERPAAQSHQAPVAIAPKPQKSSAPAVTPPPAPHIASRAASSPTATPPSAASAPTPAHFVPQEASATRVLAVGDYVQVRVTTKSETPDLETVVQVDGAGQVTLPYIGKVKLGGLFLPVATETLTLRYADGFYVNPRISVVLMQPASSSDPVSKGTAP